MAPRQSPLMVPMFPATTSRDARVWLEHSLAREKLRGDAYQFAGGLEKKAHWFNPRWRSVIIEWFGKVGAVYGMDLTTIENAVFFLDEYIFAQMSGGKVLCREDFQMVAMVALLISSKMFGVVGSQVTIIELIRLAPQLRITPQDVCITELTIIQALKFNLFVTTSSEFVSALIGLFQHTADLGATPESSSSSPSSRSSVADGNGGGMEGTLSWALEYLKYLERDFANISYYQSVKAVAAGSCALARWSIRHQDLPSGADEASAMATWLEGVAYSSASPSDSTAYLWRDIIASIPGLSPLTDPHVLAMQQLILKAVARGRGLFCAITPTATESTTAGRQSGRSAGAASVPEPLEPTGSGPCGNIGDGKKTLSSSAGGSVITARPRARRPSIGGSTPQSSPIRVGPTSRAIVPLDTSADIATTVPVEKPTSTTAFSAVKPDVPLGNTCISEAEAVGRRSASKPLEEREASEEALSSRQERPKLLTLIKPTIQKATSNTATCSPVDVCDIDCIYPIDSMSGCPATQDRSKTRSLDEVESATNSSDCQNDGPKNYSVKRRKVAVRRSARVRA